MAKQKSKKEDRRFPYTDISSVASATECTGLTQFIPETDHETESFKDFYDIPLSAEDVKKPGKRKNSVIIERNFHP